MKVTAPSVSPVRSPRHPRVLAEVVAHANRRAGRWLGALSLVGLIACGGGGGGGEPPVGSGKDTGTDVDKDGGPIDPNAVCGDGLRQAGEACDDGNALDGDGCPADCRSSEPNYDCSVAGEPCLFTCGNSGFEAGEACDDGNLDDGDGCSARCMAEEGFGCARPGSACVPISVCGNGQRERGEECDSGPTSDPGCNACKAEAGYWCSTPGQPCVARVCGNGVRTPEEACDDGATADGDGCSGSCTIEPGWRCNMNGCREICGDGVLRGSETCEDGNTASGDGCSAGCGIEPGKACNTPGQPCGNAVCGNSIKEGSEGCDDGNQVASDGCGPTCQLEPQVTVGSNPVVQTRCGDGLRTNGEACDDGNDRSGDGCSSACAMEPGFSCDEQLTYPASVRFRVTYRDFKGRHEVGGHPHMRQVNVSPPSSGLDLGITGTVCNTANAASCGRLDAQGKPALAAGTHGTVNTAGANYPEAFALWYRDSNPTSIAGANGVIDMSPNPGSPAGGDNLLLTRVGQTEAYTFDNTSFYPLNARGFGTTPGQSNNYYFTTELRSFFQYKGGETLTFRGDDDVWVFINGRLAVDIGGIHEPEWGRVVLGDDGMPSGGDSSCTVGGGGTTPATCNQTAAEAADNTDSRFGLTKGNVYEIVLFQAERQPTGSNFRLTLSGFLAPRTYCTPVCGDGMTVGWESCDDGAANADNTYGVCNTTCSGSEYCGDSLKQPSHEACDNGFNLDLYAGAGASSCAPGCVLPPSCGDGVVNAPYELCDQGAQNADGTYDGCKTNCSWGPYCGDGVVDPGEQCDNGVGNTAYSETAGACGYDCMPAFILL